MRFQAPKGTHDVLPPQSRRWEDLIARFGEQVGRAGYGLIQQPIFEDIGVFQRMGEGTDVVRKEMYDFHDKADRHLALRPEGTAAVARAFVQHSPLVPWKVWYAAPSFRYEEPQEGRYRQHHQLGVEALGSNDPDLDVEIVALLADFYRGLGLQKVELRLNSLGELADRARYLDVLREFLRANRADLDPEDAAKVEDHPMRVLDSKRPESQEVAAAAPKLFDSLSDDARVFFDRVCTGLDAYNIAWVLEPRLVRGLDYYTHTTFEFVSTALESAQSTIGGGGRYDGLVEALGGNPTPGVGFGTGIERLLLALDAEEIDRDLPSPIQVFVVDTTGGEIARELTRELRLAGIGADRAFDGRSMKSQMKSANRSDASIALIIGEDERGAQEVMVRPLRDERDQRRIGRHELLEHLRQELS